jgi:Tfp pilus assembly protein PilN
MLNWFKKIVARIRGTHSVDAALSSVTKLIARLEAVAAHHNVQAEVHDAIVKASVKARELAQKEESRAMEAANRIRRLVE